MTLTKSLLQNLSALLKKIFWNLLTKREKNHKWEDLLTSTWAKGNRPPDPFSFSLWASGWVWGAQCLEWETWLQWRPWWCCRAWLRPSNWPKWSVLWTILANWRNDGLLTPQLWLLPPEVNGRVSSMIACPFRWSRLTRNTALVT